ncbi:MAG: hypothetical protein R3F46_15020 [bacterium]
MSSTQNSFILRPLELKHLFDFTIRLLRFNFVPMFLAMAMVQLPVSLLAIPMTVKLVEFSEKLQDPSFISSSASGTDFFNTLVLEYGDSFMFIIGSLLVVAVYQLLVSPLGMLTCIRLAARALDGYRDDFASAFRFAQSRYWATQVALATYFLPTVALALVVLLLVLAAQALGNNGMTIGVSVSGIFLIWAAVMVTMVMYFRYFPALCGALQACETGPDPGMVGQGIWYLKRAWGLTQHNYVRIALMMFIMSIAWNMFSRGLSSTIELSVLLWDYMNSGAGFDDFIMAQAEGQTDPRILGLQMTLMTVVLLIFPPLWQCFKLLLYVDLRCRKEALDIYMLLVPESESTQRGIAAPE